MDCEVNELLFIDKGSEGFLFKSITSDYVILIIINHSRLRTSKQERHTYNILKASLEPLPSHNPEFHSLTSFSPLPTLAPHPLLSPTHLFVSAVLPTLIRGILISNALSPKIKTNISFSIFSIFSNS